MSTKMVQADWTVALEVFRASLPRRGDKGRNDRLFLEAMPYFSAHNRRRRGSCRSAPFSGRRSQSGFAGRISSLRT